LHSALVSLRRSRLYADARDRLAQGAQGIEAGVAEFEAELVFAFCLEGVVAFVASGVGRALALFPDVNFWMDFGCVHKFSPGSIGHAGGQIGLFIGVAGKGLTLVSRNQLCESSQRSCKKAQRCFGVGWVETASGNLHESPTDYFLRGVKTVIAGAAPPHCKGCCGLGARRGQRFDERGGIRQNVSVRYSSGPDHAIWSNRHKGVNLFAGLGEL
jgi:hypothetical protein